MPTLITTEDQHHAVLDKILYCQTSHLAGIEVLELHPEDIGFILGSQETPTRTPTPAMQRALNDFRLNYAIESSGKIYGQQHEGRTMHPITSRDQHEAALERILLLMNCNPAQGSELEDELLQLADAVEAYEDVVFPLGTGTLNGF